VLMLMIFVVVAASADIPSAPLQFNHHYHYHQQQQHRRQNEYGESYMEPQSQQEGLIVAPLPDSDSVAVGQVASQIGKETLDGGDIVLNQEGINQDEKQPMVVPGGDEGGIASNLEGQITEEKQPMAITGGEGDFNEEGTQDGLGSADHEGGENECQHSHLSSPLNSTTTPYTMYGSVFDIKTKSSNPGPITITTLDIYTNVSEQINYEVYTKNGSYVGYIVNASAWTLISSGSIVSNGDSKTTTLPSTEFTSAEMLPDTTHAFYVTLKSSNMLLGAGDEEDSSSGGMFHSSTDELELLEGAGVLEYPLVGMYSEPRQFLGMIHYTSDFLTCETTDSGNSSLPENTTTTSSSDDESPSLPNEEEEFPPMATTSVKFDFFITRPTSPAEEIDDVKDNMKESVQNTLDSILSDDGLSESEYHKLTVENVVVFGSDGDCLSADTDNSSATCSEISTEVVLQHVQNLSSEEANHLIIVYYDDVYDALPYESENVFAEANVVISLAGTAIDHVMSDEEIYIFEKATETFLTGSDEFDNDEVDILDVRVVKQTLCVDGEMVLSSRVKEDGEYLGEMNNWVMESKGGDDEQNNEGEITGRVGACGNDNEEGDVVRKRRRLETDTAAPSEIKVFTLILASYVPPPERRLPQLVVDSFSRNSEIYVSDFLNMEASKDDGNVSSFFNNIESATAASEGITPSPDNSKPGPGAEDNDWDDLPMIIALAGCVIASLLVIIGLVSVFRWRKLKSQYTSDLNKAPDTADELPIEGEDDQFDSQIDNSNHDYDEGPKAPPPKSFIPQHSLRNGAGGLGVEDDLHLMFNKPHPS